LDSGWQRGHQPVLYGDSRGTVYLHQSIQLIARPWLNNVAEHMGLVRNNQFVLSEGGGQSQGRGVRTSLHLTAIPTARCRKVR
jgi:hypothetical protein